MPIELCLDFLYLNHVQSADVTVPSKIAACRPHMQRLTGEAGSGRRQRNNKDPPIAQAMISGISVSRCWRTAPKRPSPAQAPRRSSLRPHRGCTKQTLANQKTEHQPRPRMRRSVQSCQLCQDQSGPLETKYITRNSAMPLRSTREHVQRLPAARCPSSREPPKPDAILEP